jgi:glycosyltransferase involved in cell wall biosynthesis
MWVTDWASGPYRARLRLRAREWQPDIVHAEYHVMGQYLSALGGSRAARVLTEYEPGIGAAPYLKQRLPLLGPLIHRLDQLAWRRFEPVTLRRAQAVVVFTERDRRTLDATGAGVPIHCIPLGAAIPEHPLDPLGQPPVSLLFVGSAVHPPNADAAVRLARSIFPLVQERHPEAVLTLVGDQLPGISRQLAGQNVVVTGRVPDVTPYLDRAAVYVAPLRLGGGMRVKVLEALAAGKALVASPLAAEGLDVRGGEQILFAESDQQFAARINELLDDAGWRAALARGARAWACAHLSWDRSVAAYEAMYDSLCGGSKL